MTKKRKQYGGGISTAWSPVNQAWLVFWHESVLRIISDADELDWYLRYELKVLG